MNLKDTLKEELSQGGIGSEHEQQSVKLSSDYIYLKDQIIEVIADLKSERDQHRNKRNFLNDHNYTVEAMIENKMYISLDHIVIDLELAVKLSLI